VGSVSVIGSHSYDEDEEEEEDEIQRQQDKSSELARHHAMQEEMYRRPSINTSQLHQSRVGLLSQAVMMMITVGFMFSETLEQFWKTK
jgi:hypothetical protein